MCALDLADQAVLGKSIYACLIAIADTCEHQAEVLGGLCLFVTLAECLDASLRYGCADQSLDQQGAVVLNKFCCFSCCNYFCHNHLLPSHKK